MCDNNKFLKVNNFVDIKYEFLTKYLEFHITDYKKNVINNDQYLSETYFQIERNIKRLKCKSNLLYEGNKLIREYSISIRDTFGILKPSYIVKKMKNESNTYEVRLDKTYEHYRLFFFPKISTSSDADLVLTFGLTKDQKLVNDITNELSTETQHLYSVY